MKRRAAALSVIALMIVVPLVLLVRQLGGDDQSPGTTVVVPVTPHAFKDPKLGLEVRWPKTWKSKIDRKAAQIQLTSKDKTTAMLFAVTTPATGVVAKALYADTIRALQGTYKHAKVALAAHPQRVSGLPTASAIVTGTNKKGVKQRISVTVARGRTHLYLIEVIAPERGGQLGDVAVIARTIILTG